MEKKFLLWGFIFGMFAVILGAFGAHGLKPILTADQLNSFETGIRYQMFHAFLLIILAKYPAITNRFIFYGLVIGTLLFSCSIYLLNLRFIFEMEFLKFLGPITPIGGLLLIVSWFILIVKTLQLKLKSSE